METENPNDLRVASFSCYLKPIEGEVNMFETSDEKFSDTMVLDSEGLKPSCFKARTPSTALEASSWSNNQWSLLQRSTAQPKPHGQTFGIIRWFNACARSPCSTKKDVHVHQSVKKVDQFTSPVLNDENAKELPQMSLEEFASGNISKGDIARNLVKNMSNITWDAIPKSKENKVLDDVGSEASSDLFEIENIARTEWQPCIMSPCAPSEASIDWSVITASATEFSPVQSDYDEKDRVYNTTTIEPTKKFQKKRSNGLLGCKSHSSVKVAEVVHRTTNKSKH